ncbi:MAG: substrate-binding domain-containing protein [Coraliomargaritaceae bacterium]
MLKPKHILLLLEWYDYRIHKGVAQMARKYGWQLHCPKNLSERSFNSEVLKDWKGDGCIAMIQCKETLQCLKSKNIPLIDLGLRDYGISIPRLITDNKKIGKLAAEHLREFGHKEIFVSHHGNNMMYKERLNSLQGYSKNNDCKVIVLKSGTNIQYNTIDEINRILKDRGKNLKESSIAFFAYNDSLAADLISLCLMNDIRVPENIAILGVDNDDLIISSLVLGLSSVDSDQEGLGRSAAKLMQSLLISNNHTLNEEIYRHPPKGVETRRSTNCYAVRNPLVSNALHWIQNNFYKGIQATDVASAMNVTQQGLQKAFASSYIRSPGNEIRHQRLEAVAFLLKTTSANLDTIAKNCGFYSVNSLINSFRKKYEQTPGKFREFHKKLNTDH